MVEWSTLIPMGKGNLRIEFVNGSITSRGIDPATFTTDNEAVQAAIESCPKFKSKKIKLVASYVIGEVKEPVVSVPDEVNASTSPAVQSENTEGAAGENAEEVAGVFPVVKNSQQAKDILMEEPYNVSLADLGNKTAILAKAAELGVSFPNWK